MVKDVKVVIPLRSNDFINYKIEKFVKDISNKRQSANYYSENRNCDYEKAKKDQFLGKKAEFFALYYLMKECDYPFVEPDIKVYDVRNKSWNADLPFNEIDKNFPNIHVKSCDRKYNDDYSWVFQYGNNSDKFGRDKLFSDGFESDLITFIQLEDPKSNIAIIKAILPWGTAQKYLENPFFPKFIGLKKCIYHKTLQRELNGIN